MMNRLFRPVDISSLATLRIMFGALMVAAMARYFLYGWIDAMYVAPQFFFTYDGFDWVRVWPGVGMYVHYAALVGLALCVATGFAYRASILLFFVGFTYAHLIDKTNYLNHYYLLSLIAFLLIFMPLGRAWSWSVYRRPEERIGVVPQWMIWILRFQLAVVYVFAGLAKLDADWLLHAQPLRLWLAAQGEVPMIGPLLVSDWAPYLFSWAGAIFDLTIVPFLLWRRTRMAAYVCVVAFHAVTALLFPIGLFPWIMIGLTTVFFEPDWPRRVIGWIRRPDLRAATRNAQPQRRTHPLAPSLGKREGTRISNDLLPAPFSFQEKGVWGMSSVLRRADPWLQQYAVVALLGVYAAVQLAVPLRSLAQPGAVNWTEDGFRFAWRVMLIEKYGRAVFEVRDVATDERERIDPSLYLSPLQVRMMSTQPDMVLQFAHWLHAREEERGREVEVRGRIEVSLNGRPHEPLVDPHLNLAAIPSGTPAGRWVLPLPHTHAGILSVAASRSLR